MEKKRQKQLTAQILCALVLGGSLLTGGEAAAATIIEPQTYSDSSDGNVTDTITIENGFVRAYGNDSSKTIALKGDITIVQAAFGESVYGRDGDTFASSDGPYALRVYRGAASGNSLVLDVNPDGDKTVKIDGNVVARGHIDGQGYTGRGQVKLWLNNEASYLAGSLQLKRSASDDAVNKIDLKVNNGATWYIPEGDNSYDFSQKTKTVKLMMGGARQEDSWPLTIDAAGGRLDIWHSRSGSYRSTAAGTRSFGLTMGTGSTLNGATFVVSSDVRQNKVDTVALTGATGTNTYYVQVAYDPAMDTDGTYTADNAVVLTTNNLTDIVNGKAYTTTQDKAAGLVTKEITLTPTLTSSEGTTKLTALTVTSNGSGTDGSGTDGSSTAGPAQLMAQAAQSTAGGMAGAWRSENNELLRRLGDLRGHSEDAGAWVRMYSGENEIRSGQGVNLTYTGVQGGYDWDRSWQGGRLFTGIAISHLRGSGSYASGSGTVKSNLFGIYGSYLGDKGHYADLILKYGRASSDFDTASSTAVYSGSNSRNGFSISAEYGRRQELAKGWFLEPQAELTYSHMAGTDYTMTANGAAGANIHEDGVNSLVGRVGGIYGCRTKDGNVYLKLGLLHEFNGDSVLDTSYGSYSRRVDASGRDTWLEYGVGFNAKTSANSQVYGEFMKTAGAEKIINKWMLNAGFRLNF